jgi:threonine dehydratase
VQTAAKLDASFSYYDKMSSSFGVSDVQAAAARIQPHVVCTPLLEFPLLNSRLGGRILIKAEVLQHTGSFKCRGAFNALLSLPAGTIGPEPAPYRSVVAFSSGNHAQGVAYACAQLKYDCTIVMPQDAPRLKIANTRAYGANVVFYDRIRDDREAIARKIATEKKAFVIPPYNSLAVMAGQGTCGLEIVKQLEEMRIERIDMCLVPASGGGLIAGVSTAVKQWCPSAQCIVVEPFGHDDHARSLSLGKRVANGPDAPSSICDALMAAEPGDLTFAVNRQTLSRGLAVTDRQVEAAMLEFASATHLVVEPGGAVGLAAVLAGQVDVRGKTVVIVASGGNTDPIFLADAISRQLKSNL